MPFDNGDNHEDENPSVINRKKIISIVKQVKNELKISDLTNIELWKAFRDKFHDYILQRLENVNKIDLRDLWTMLRKRNVYISQKQSLSVIWALFLVLDKSEKAL